MESRNKKGKGGDEGGREVVLHPGDRLSLKLVWRYRPGMRLGVCGEGRGAAEVSKWLAVTLCNVPLS